VPLLVLVLPAVSGDCDEGEVSPRSDASLSAAVVVGVGDVAVLSGDGGMFPKSKP
jgi:hypothetical protein